MTTGQLATPTKPVQRPSGVWRTRAAAEEQEHLPTAVFLDPNDGCLQMARVLAGRGVRVVALAGPDAAYAARSRRVEGHVLPAVSSAPDRWLDALDRVADDGPAVLIPGSDEACNFILRSRGLLAPKLLSFEAPGGAHERLMDKDGLYELASTLGIRTPATHVVRTEADLEAIDGELSFPCVAKPAVTHVGRSAGSYRPLLIEDRERLRELCVRAVADGAPMLVSEFVPGGDTELEGANVVRAADGSYPVVYTRRKVRQHPSLVGTGSVLCSDPSLAETVAMTKRICEATGHVGLANLEAKRSSVTGELYLIEINVRVPNAFGLGDASGTDASWRFYATLAELALGPQPPQRDGVKIVSPFLDMLAVRGLRRRHEISLLELARSYRGTGKVMMVDWRDPSPMLAFASHKVRARRANARAG